MTPLARDPRDDPREDADAEAARRRRAVAAVADEARADDDVGLAREHRRDQARELRGIVLAVAVEPDGELVAPSHA